MSSNVDKFFKDNLGDHSIPPAPGSWEKVESRLSKKNNLSLVLKVAAAIAVAGMFVALMITQTHQPVPAPLAKEEVKSVPLVKPTPAAERPNEADKVLPVQPDPPGTVARRSTKKIKVPEATTATEQVVLELPKQDLTAEVTQAEAAKAKRIVLVYSLPTVGKKTEVEVDAVAVAPSDEEKRTGLRKVMDVALEVKSGDNPLGELREAKDELFALEFRKDKNNAKNH
jgi:hypothetical protein